ncbi:tryptophan 2,3-dioxygenase [Nakamurella flavida]|uniref:Tryptophan 2,3-dioxygenase n=1 Tax=Nakamurella flavida TaxID=363630 RepID=A0A938YNA9_9ACTN|nr:tryptophan 2,3-dioxygenase [Nakamurella flavida]MBM9476359.1 tryptophan 2,3-dioxygenase [Nakamurella flavida]MDP9779541.1 tryptophan 2,3-dioxygenase [Nakamurella flavida]
MTTQPLPVTPPLDGSGGAPAGARPLEASIHRDIARSNYADYLRLDVLLAAQQPVSDHHDEMLFIVQHQTTELWIKLVVHELRSAMALIARDELSPALKRLARVKHIQRQMTDQWSVLATLTPTEYAQFRDQLGQASGFQSAQYRLLEFLLGNKNAAMIPVFAHDPAATATLSAALAAPSLYEEFLLYLHRRGYAVPAVLLDRDRSTPHLRDEALVAMFVGIYEQPESQWEVYEACEELVDIEDTFQTWRFRHLKTVERIIGFKRGTGGSSGASFLAKALELTFFPELWAVRTEIGRPR